MVWPLAELRFGQSIRAIECDDRGVASVTTRAGETIATREVVTAVPPAALLDVLPEQVLRHPVLQDVAKLTTSPIINLWLFLDRPLWPDLPFLGLVGSPLHWLFDRTRIEGIEDGGRVLVTRFLSPLHHGEVWDVNPTGAMSLTRAIRIPKFGDDANRDTTAAGRGVANQLGHAPHIGGAVVGEGRLHSGHGDRSGTAHRIIQIERVAVA